LERIYLDTCAWCRPFDKPTHRIRIEARAVRRILSLADEARIEIIGSGIIMFEASMIDPADKRNAVLALVSRSVTRFIELSEGAEKLSKELVIKCGLGGMDAAHIASAIKGDADMFLTTDDEVLRKSKCISKFGISVNNPAIYVKVVRR